MTVQNFCKKPRVRPSTPWDLLAFWLNKVFLISFSLGKAQSKLVDWEGKIEGQLRSNSQGWGASRKSDENKLRKELWIIVFRCWESWIQLPLLSFKAEILFLFLLTRVVIWKNLVFLSPSQNQTRRDFIFQKSSSQTRISWNLAFKVLCKEERKLFGETACLFSIPWSLARIFFSYETNSQRLLYSKSELL